jgi:PBP1b-binding outer membrane lipoprotein LpoB
MKKILIVLVAALTFASCSKKEVEPNPFTATKPSKETMTVAQVKAKLGIDLIKDYDENIVSEARGKRPKENVIVVVWYNDLSLTLSGTTLTSTVSSNAQWASFQKFIDTTSNDGAVASCPKYYSTPGSAPATESCEASGIGYHRFYTSDFGYNAIHLSNWVSN